MVPHSHLIFETEIVGFEVFVSLPPFLSLTYHSMFPGDLDGEDAPVFPKFGSRTYFKLVSFPLLYSFFLSPLFVHSFDDQIKS